MVRTYQRKSTYSKYNKDHILKAVKAIKVDSKSLTKVADEYGIKVSSLYYHLNRYKYYDFTKEKEIKALKNFNQVFTKELEYEFAEQFVDATDYCIGLGPLNIRKFAYEFAMQNELDLRQTWMENETAGEDWLNAFLKRHPMITNISTFNTHSIQTFYKNYEELLTRFKFQDSKILKADEIALVTAVQPNRVFARRGKKDTIELESVGQDELTTMVSTVSASGSALTPMFKIPRTSFTTDMIEKALEGSLRVSNKSGWLSKSDFLEYLTHLVKVTQCDKTDPCLLILDNHASSLSLESIAYAKENGVFMLILPLHTYNKLQPLKDKVFVNLRNKVNTACTKWLKERSKPLKIKDLLKIVEKIFPQVFKTSDIVQGFETSNLYPLNNKTDTDDGVVPTKNIITMVDNGVVSDADPCSDANDVDPLAIDIDFIKKEALEDSTELVVKHSPKDVESSAEMPLSEIESILGISSPLERREIKKEDSDIVKSVKVEIIDDDIIDESELKTDIQPNKKEGKVIKNKKNVSKTKRLKVSKPVKSEAGRTKRRKPKLNSKLSDYICY